MALKQFEPYSPKPDSELVIARLNKVIENYIKQGYRLTVRQLYYQMIAQDLFPDTWIDTLYNKKQGLDPNTKNTVKNYKKLGDLLGKARLGGMVDWDAIEDRGRNLAGVSAWDSPEQIIGAVARQYRRDLWADQPWHVQVWVEKDALSNVMERACFPLRVSYMACKGYMSLSEMHVQGTYLGSISRHKKVRIIHLGDHDPSGIAMTDDIEERLSMFAGRPIEVKRIALNMDQVLQWNPPENPAKESDPRFASYEAQYGNISWELDALRPDVLVNQITAEINAVRDLAIWNESLGRETHEKQQLEWVKKYWQGVTTYVEGRAMGLSDEDEDEDEDQQDDEDDEG